MSTDFSKLAAAIALLLGCTWLVSPVVAGKLYKWVDESGNVTYQDKPPPDGAEYVEESDSDVTAGGEATTSAQDRLTAASASAPLTLYTISDCDGCDLIRAYLNKRSMPFDEKDVETNVAFQEELKARAGRLEVPTLMVGDQALKGYNKQALDTELRTAGYPEPDELANQESPAPAGNGQAAANQPDETDAPELLDVPVDEEFLEEADALAEEEVAIEGADVPLDEELFEDEDIDLPKLDEES